VDAGDYKQYIFPLLFYKRISDVWDAEYADAFAETRDKAYAEQMANERFVIPPKAHWNDVREKAKDVGKAIQNAFRAIESANLDKLDGIFGDAPVLQAMYLDKPMRDHTLLQAITRTNRTYGDKKSFGLIVDYLGIFDDVAKSLEFDEEGFRRVVSDIVNLKTKFPEAMQKCLAYFAGVDKNISGYEGLIVAQECLPNNDVRDSFAANYSYLSSLWEAISPDPLLAEYESDYRWLSQVYVSVQPTSGAGALLWHSLGAKTIELIHQNVHVSAVRDDLDETILDAELLEAVLKTDNPDRKAKELQIKIVDRLRKHMGNPLYSKLSDRLEKLKELHEAG
jgi:type I restriction enzyme, R subunit